MDTTTYPDDRHTRQTPIQRKRKLDAARAHARTALRDLQALCEDFDANAYRLTAAETAEWREAAQMHDAIAKAIQ